jgi:hypothetical protein
MLRYLLTQAKELSRRARDQRTAIVRRVFNESLNAIWRDLFVRLAPDEPFVPAFALPESDGDLLPDPGGNSFGIGQTTGGLYFFNSTSGPGNTTNPANYLLTLSDTGNVSQRRDRGGTVKAMVYVNSDGTVNRCFNGQTGASTGNCGFVTGRSGSDYSIDFGFQVTDRFASLTPGYSGTAFAGAALIYGGTSTSVIEVHTYVPGNTQGVADFTVIIY